MLVGTSLGGPCGSRSESRSARSRLGRGASQESGFTLLEALVVALIIGVLAAIFLPSLLSQAGKALDAQAKTLVRTAQTAVEASASENGDSYANVSTVELNRIEPAIRIAASGSEAYLSSATGAKGSYSVTVKAPNGDEFTVTRNASGEVARECVSPRTKTGCSGGETGSW